MDEQELKMALEHDAAQKEAAKQSTQEPLASEAAAPEAPPVMQWGEFIDSREKRQYALAKQSEVLLLNIANKVSEHALAANPAKELSFIQRCCEVVTTLTQLANSLDVLADKAIVRAIPAPTQKLTGK